MSIHKISMVLIIILLKTTLLLASDLPVILTSKLDSPSKLAMENALKEVSILLPEKFKLGLPSNIALKIEKLSEHQEIPSDVCSVHSENDKLKKKFIYGVYNRNRNSLSLNTAVLRELIKGRTDSTRISCQHKTLYDQAIATIIHELTHAYDYNNGSPSRSDDFLRRADFKKGLLKIKSKNNVTQRSVDPYELVNAVESFAVNMEYFTMDSEYACRKPGLFDYLKKSFESDPYPNRSCSVGNVVMMSTNSGLYPVQLDLNRIYRIDYLMASPGKDLSSGFGHSMFRLVICAPEHLDSISNKIIPATPFGEKCLEDKLYHLVVSYRANVEDATLNYVKGIMGGYPSMLFILNFSDVLDEYNRDELRDVVAYPLKLSAKDKRDIVYKVIEEHWSYRGSYKFFTNNCAVESLDLLKGSLETNDLQGTSSPTPNGVLEDLDHIEVLSIKSGTQEVYKSHIDQLLLAFNKAFGAKTKNAKKDKETLLKFIKDSKTEDRLVLFEKNFSQESSTQNMHEKIVLRKESLIKSSSFSVLEQQILRSKLSDLRKKAAEVMLNSNDERVKNILESNGGGVKESFNTFAKKGYGVPLLSEILNPEDFKNRDQRSKNAIINAEILFKDLFPDDIATIQAINANIAAFNQKSIALRKDYRIKLEVYINQVIKNLTYEDEGRNLLIRAISSKSDLNRVRALLGEDLVTEKEILDGKLIKLIQDNL